MQRLSCNKKTRKWDASRPGKLSLETFCHFCYTCFCSWETTRFTTRCTASVSQSCESKARKVTFVCSLHHQSNTLHWYTSCSCINSLCNMIQKCSKPPFFLWGKHAHISVEQFKHLQSLKERHHLRNRKQRQPSKMIPVAKKSCCKEKETKMPWKHNRKANLSFILCWLRLVLNGKGKLLTRFPDRKRRGFV